MNIEEIKEGMYVKYTRGLINGYVPPRIAKITDCSDKDLIKIDNGQVILRNDILKVSKKIKDLVGVGDYINGMKIVAKDSDNRLYVTEDLGQPYDREFYNGCFEYTILDERFKIKSIVTKEQFDSMKYEVDSNE